MCKLGVVFYFCLKESFVFYRLLALLVFATSSCATQGVSVNGVPFDQVPMYGGLDRNTNPTLRAADEKLIQDTTQHYGSREKASASFTDTAFNYYRQGNVDFAMRRFNQAWLMNPNNPEVYWGFASVLHDQGKFCDGLKLLEIGLSKGPIQKGYMPDHAVLYAGCARHGQGISLKQRSDFLEKSTEIFAAAERDSEVPKPYLYFQWARTHYALGEYTSAWEKIKEYRKYTSNPVDDKLLTRLSEKLPEPK
mgnify:CR=1 FL=1